MEIFIHLQKLLTRHFLFYFFRFNFIHLGGFGFSNYNYFLHLDQVFHSKKMIVHQTKYLAWNVPIWEKKTELDSFLFHVLYSYRVVDGIITCFNLQSNVLVNQRIWSQFNIKSFFSYWHETIVIPKRNSSFKKNETLPLSKKKLKASTESCKSCRIFNKRS